MMITLETVAGLWNLIVFCVYGVDKLCARAHKKRVREATLILLAFFLGGAGAMFGMIVFNHKTSKMKFRLSVPLAVIMNVVVVVWVKYFFV